MPGTTADILEPMLTKQGTPAAGTVAPPKRSRVLRRVAVSSEDVDRLRGRLVEPGPLTRAELIVCAALLTLLAAVAFGSHVQHGGFLMDDWSNAAKSRYLASCCGLGETGQGLGYASQFHNMLGDGPAGYHLGLPVILPVVYFLFGIHMTLHLALAAMLGVAMSWGAYVLMRKLGLAPLHAGVIGALVLVFPWSSSTRLWAMASFNQVAVLLWIAGVLVALRGLRHTGARAVAFHVAALVLYVLATLTYELAGGLVVASAVFYLFRGTWRQALVRAVPDVAAAYLSLQFVKNNALPRPVSTFDQATEHARFILDQSITVLARTAFPFGAPARNLIVGLMVLAFVAAGVAWRVLPPGDAVRETSRRWLIVAAVGVATVVAGYLTLFPAIYGAPLDAGIENRVNMISAFGYVAIAYAAAMIAGAFIVRRLRRPPRLAVALPLALSALMAIGFLVKLEADAGNYDASFAEGQRTLHGMFVAYGVKGPPPSSVSYAFNFPSFTAPGVPVFAWIWDLPGAMKMTFNDSSIAGFPILPGTSWKCNKKDLFPVSPYGTGPGEGAAYGSAFFVDVTAGVKQRIDSKAECESAQQRFKPGPLARGSDCNLLGGGPASRLAWACATKPGS